jgi:hypothetical protein
MATIDLFSETLSSGASSLEECSSLNTLDSFYFFFSISEDILTLLRDRTDIYLWNFLMFSIVSAAFYLSRFIELSCISLIVGGISIITDLD